MSVDVAAVLTMLYY